MSTDFQATSAFDLDLDDLELALILGVAWCLWIFFFADAILCTLLILDELLLLVPFDGLVQRLPWAHAVEDLTDASFLVVVSNVDDLLGLEAVILINQLIQWQSGTTELHRLLVGRSLSTSLCSWNVEEVYKDGVLLEVLDVEIIDRVLKAKERIVDGLDSNSHVRALGIVIVEVESEECLDLTRLDFMLVLGQELCKHDSIEAC